MEATYLSLSERKAKLLSRCEIQRSVMTSLCAELQQSMSWVDIAYSVAATFTPKAKLILPIIAMVVGSRMGPIGKIGSVVSKVITGWHFFKKIRSIKAPLSISSIIASLTNRSVG